MPVTVVPTSSQQSAKKKSTTSRKRRRDQNEEIHELASLVPLSSSQLSGLIPSNGGKPQTISVLRLATTFLKLQSFIKDASPLNSIGCEQVTKGRLNLGRMEEAIDGFLIVLDKDANILYVSETIAGHVGLIQQDVIGQNFADITHPEFAAEIRDSLKPSVLLPTSMSEDVVISQYRQFYVRIVPNVAYSTSPSNSIVLVRGNLKVKLSPSNITTKGALEFIEPLVVGFIGECRVVEMAASILEISIPHSSFTITRSLDMQRVISVEASVKDVVGYDPEVILAANVDVGDFLHPSDQDVVLSMRKFLLQNGHVVSPRFRFLTSSGEWVWLQLEGTLRSNFWEIKIRALGQWGGNLKYIEQKELYSSESDRDTHRKSNAVPKLTGTGLSKYRTEDGAGPIVNSLKSTRIPESVLEPVLHGRFVAMNDFSELVKQMNNDSASSTSMQHSHHQAASPTANSNPSPDTLTTSTPSAQSVTAAQSCPRHESSSSTTSISGQSGECGLKPLLATEPVTIAQSQELLQKESCHSILTVPNPVEGSGVQSPLMSGSSVDYSPVSSAMTVSPPQQDFIPSPEQFLDFASPVEVYATPYDSATADFGASLSGHPADSNIMHTVPQTVAGTDSIPFTASGPFQDLYSQAPNFIPRPHSSIDSQNPQISSTNFNFSSNSSTYFPQTSDGTPCIDVTPVQVFDNLNPPLDDASTASLMQQIVDDIVMMDEPNFNPTASVSADYSTNSMGANVTYSQGTGDGSLVLNSNSLSNAGQYCPSSNSPMDAVDYDGDPSISADLPIILELNSQSSNPDVQDILKQFM